MATALWRHHPSPPKESSLALLGFGGETVPVQIAHAPVDLRIDVAVTPASGPVVCGGLPMMRGGTCQVNSQIAFTQIERVSHVHDALAGFIIVSSCNPSRNRLKNPDLNSSFSGSARSGTIR